MSNNVTKNEIVDNIFRDKKGDIERKDILAVVNAFIDEIKGSLEAGKNIELRGFGTFELKVRSRKTYRNPKTDGNIDKKPRYKATFKPGQSLEENIEKLDVDPVLLENLKNK